MFKQSLAPALALIATLGTFAIPDVIFAAPAGSPAIAGHTDGDLASPAGHKVYTLAASLNESRQVG